MSTSTLALRLTTIPADHPLLVAQVRNWTDRAQVHKAVMSLFPTTLPGDQGQRRAGGGILYRLEDTPSGRPRLLIQHTSPLRDTVPHTRSLPLQPFLDRLKAETVVRFRVDLNAVSIDSRTRKRVPIRNTYFAPDAQLPDDVHQAVVRETFDGTIAVDRLTPYLSRKLRDALTNLTLLDEPAVTVHRAGSAPLHIAQFKGYGIVSSTDHLNRLVVHGIGKAKAYGCGLLSLAPASPARRH